MQVNHHNNTTEEIIKLTFQEFQVLMQDNNLEQLVAAPLTEAVGPLQEITQVTIPDHY